MTNTDDPQGAFDELPFPHETLTSERSHPNHWYNRAADLRTSAGATWYAIRFQPDDMNEKLGLPGGNSANVACYPVYHLLCGLAIEVLLKAVIAQREAPPESHDLLFLANRAGIPLKDKEKRLMKFYGDALVWAGRYPTPRNCSDTKLLDHYEFATSVLTMPVKMGSIQLVTGNGATEWEKFHALWKRLAEHFSFQN